MENDTIQIRVAEEEDAEALLEIYAPYIRDTAITFEYEVPSVEEFRKRIHQIREKYPYLLAESGGEILGYAYAAAFHKRAALGWAVESSIYIRQDKKGMGVGRRLYESLERCLTAQGVLNVNASIAYPEKEDEYLTRDSIRFHEHMGYHWVGEFHQCGYKFDRWYSLVWMEKHIGSHAAFPSAVRPFAEVQKETELSL